MREDELLALFQDLSNWGRWGPDDQAGTLNLITDERVLAAAALVRSGTVVGCARPIAPRPASTAAFSMLHMMTTSGDAAPAEGMGNASDWVGIGVHGFDFTHVDAHSHMFWDGCMYNGRPASLCSTERGAVAGGVEPVFSGATSRGVLVDLPRLRGVKHLEANDAVGPEDLDRWYESVGLAPEPGDFVFVRTGRDRWEADGVNIDSTQLPGMDARCLPWLHRHDVSVLTSDVIHDRLPSGFDQVPLPIHCVGIVAMGLWLVDNAALGELARTCDRLDQFEFLATLAPIPFRRATGSLVNPIAHF